MEADKSKAAQTAGACPGLESLKRIKAYAATIGGLDKVRVQAQELRCFMEFADGVGGVDKLLEQVEFLQELAA